MRRSCQFILLAALLFPACAVYHYEDHLPGENVVFKNSSSDSAGDEVVTSTTPATATSVVSEPAPVIVAPPADSSAAPAWTKKVAFDDIERGKQVYYGVGRFYYQAPTKKELDKAKAQADERAILELTKIVRSSTDIKGELDGVVIHDTWQDSAQMAIYSLAKYTVK